jgi:hypothetical protein
VTCDIGKNGTGQMTGGRNYVSGTGVGEWRCDTVVMCKCSVCAAEIEYSTCEQK